MFTAPVGSFIQALGIQYHMYTDDTQIYTAIDARSQNCLSQLIGCANAVTGWLIRNNLLLNTNQTKAIITGMRQQVTKFGKAGGFAVSVSIIPFAQILRVLGVIIDDQLSFDYHITDIVQAYTTSLNFTTSAHSSTATRRMPLHVRSCSQESITVTSLCTVSLNITSLGDG